MAGMKVVVVKAADDGAVDLDDLRATVRGSTPTTWPRSWSPTRRRTASTRTPSPSCARSCTTHGGQVYVDGANLNALLGYARARRVRRRRLAPQPAQDVLHPARRRRPGRRPGRACARTWRRTCPPTRCTPRPTKREGIGPISAAPYGSAGILPISWAYIRLMGAEGLTRATAVAVLVGQLRRARGSDEHFPVLYTRPRRAGRARVHPRPARHHQGRPASPSTTSPSG